MQALVWTRVSGRYLIQPRRSKRYSICEGGDYELRPERLHQQELGYTLSSGRHTHIIHPSIPDSSKSTTRSFPQKLQLHPPNITLIPLNLYQIYSSRPLKKTQRFHPIYSEFESKPPYSYTRLSPNLDLA